MKKLVIAALAAAVMVSGCAGYARVTSYPTKLADAKVSVGGMGYSVWFHRTDKSIMVQRAAGAVLAQTLIELPGMSLQEPAPIWEAAAKRVLEEFGCKAAEVYRLEATSYEARYECPDGRFIDEAEIAPKREAMRKVLQTANPLKPGQSQASAHP